MQTRSSIGIHSKSKPTQHRGQKLAADVRKVKKANQEHKNKNNTKNKTFQQLPAKDGTLISAATNDDGQYLGGPTGYGKHEYAPNAPIYYPV